MRSINRDRRDIFKKSSKHPAVAFESNSQPAPLLHLANAPGLSHSLSFPSLSSSLPRRRELLVLLLVLVLFFREVNTRGFYCGGRSELLLFPEREL